MSKVQVEADIPQTVNYVATSVTVGSTTTLNPGQQATVTNSGTEQNAIFNFGIPRGKSAYEEAVEGGYEGTETEFKEALASDIATVADNISDVNAVGQSITDVNTVADNLTDISAVSTIASDVSTVSGISSDVTQVSGIVSAVSNVSDKDDEILLVSDNMASVMTTASNIGNVNTVAGITSDLATVAGISSAVSTVAANNSNVTAVANNETNINAVNANKTNIDTVANNTSAVSTVSTNISDVNTAATNINAIIAAPTYAANAATSATNAQTWAEGTDIQVAALGGTKSSKGWAARAQELVESIGSVLHYKGSVASYDNLPTTGQELGDMWNVTDTGANYVWTGSAWDAISGIVDLSAYRTSAAQDAIDATKANDNAVVHTTGDESIAGTKTFTTKITSPIIETGTAANNYFQSRKFRGEGDANTYYHAVDFGYQNHDQVDFYEYGGKYVFHKHTAAAIGSGDTILGTINDNGWEGNVKGNLTGTATNATADPDGNVFKTKYIKNEDVLLDMSQHSTASPKRIWQEKIDDCLYRAEARYTVTGTNFTSNNLKNLFDCNPDTVLGVSKGATGVLSITASTNFGWGYPYGYLYCVFYHKSGPQTINNVTCRVYQNWSGHNTGWVTLTGEEISSSTFNGIKSIDTLRFPCNTYGIEQIEITFDNTNGTAESSELMQICSASFFCNRTSIHSLPVLTKHGGDTVYGNLTIPTASGSFIGNVTGNASTATSATSATQDGNGNVITSTYLPLAGGTMTGDLNFAGANNRIAGFTLTENGNNVDGGWNWANKDGAGFYLRSSSHSAAGEFGFFARNSAGTTKKLIGSVNGSLTWDGSEIQRATHKGAANGIASLDANTKIPIAQLPTMTGATGSVAGDVGAVPAPAATDNNKFLKGDGTWANPTATTAWGNITGTLSDQTDLQNALNSLKRNVGEIVHSTIPLTDAGLHLLDGALLSGDGAYAAFVTYIGQLVSSHPELFTTEADWQACVAAYGVCGKFVYTAAAGADPATVRLPKKASAKRYLIASSVSGTEWCDVYSDGWCEQGGFLAGSSNYRENIVFTKAFADTNYTAYFGAQYTSTANNEPLVETSTKATTGFTLIKTNTSTFDVYWEVKGYADVSDYESESLYQYIVIANSTKTAIEVDIDEIATDLNGKADVDLSNVSGTSGFRKLVEVYNNGASWYKVYSEYNPTTGTFIGNWCEQGGTIAANEGSTNVSVTFLKQFADTNYAILVTKIMDSGNSDQNAVLVRTKSASGATINKLNTNIQAVWEAKGYIL